MKLSKYIEQLQRLLDTSGDAEIYRLGEFGEHEGMGYIETVWKITKEGYYDTEKDDFVEDEYGVDYYYVV